MCFSFCGKLFVLLYFFFWPLCCQFFSDIRILITPVVSSNSSLHGLPECFLCHELIHVATHMTPSGWEQGSAGLSCLILWHKLILSVELHLIVSGWDQRFYMVYTIDSLTQILTCGTTLDCIRMRTRVYKVQLIYLFIISCHINSSSIYNGIYVSSMT
jgi:hypothetical protein